MQIGCAECGCVVERGVRVIACAAPSCCCSELPATDVELVADLKAQDDDGLGWSTLADARDRSRARPGADRPGG